MVIQLDKVLDKLLLDKHSKNQLTMLQCEDIYKRDYESLREVGRGRFAVVFEVINRKTREKFAAKHIKIRKKECQEMAHQEISILSGLSHENILKLVAAYHLASKREVCLLTEFLEGGELFEKVVSQDFPLTEKECAIFLRQICQGVSYLHSKRIAHLDLKPENVVVISQLSEHIKIVDFGFAKYLPPDQPEVKVLCGTPEFVPPEILSYEPISLESDIWSLGVIAYVLLSGLSPFLGDCDAETCANVTCAEISFDEPDFDEISENAKNFISLTIVKEKEDRLKADQCLQHPWLTDIDAIDKASEIRKDNLKKFVARRRWQKCGRIVRALNRISGKWKQPPELELVTKENAENDSANFPQFIFAEKFISTAEIILE